MVKEIFHNSFEKFKIYKDLYGKQCKRDWVAKVVFLVQMLLTLIYGRCNHFGDIILKFSGYLILIRSFRLCQQNFSKLFSCLPKADHVINSCLKGLLISPKLRN